LSGESFCSRCGSRIPVGAGFCPNCGLAVSGPPSGQPQSPATPRRQEKYYGRGYEKQEQHNEKGEKNEKGRGGDITGAITGGLILVWLGVTFFLQENGYLASGNWWAYFIMGIGAILILHGVMRSAMSRRPFVGSFIGGVVLIIIGFAFIQGFTASLWPLILVAIGVAVLVSAMMGRRRRPPP
jgi:hypothetical protein